MHLGPSKNQPFLLYSKSYLSEIKATSLDPLSSPDHDFSRFSVRFVEDAHTMDYYRLVIKLSWSVVKSAYFAYNSKQLLNFIILIGVRGNRLKCFNYFCVFISAE